jgi:dTDP-4-amino-4,6-dideoxygalactose transaminase
MLKTLDMRNRKRKAYRQKIYDAVKNIPALQPRKSYAKANDAGFYGGMHLVFHPEKLGNLPTAKFVEALKAEGVNMHHRGYELTHLLKLFADGYDITGKGMGPLCGDYKGYKKGSLPLTEEVHNRIIGMPTYIDENPGYSDQVIAAINKVVKNFTELL